MIAGFGASISPRAPSAPCAAPGSLLAARVGAAECWSPVARPLGHSRPPTPGAQRGPGVPRSSGARDSSSLPERCALGSKRCWRDPRARRLVIRPFLFPPDRLPSPWLPALGRILGPPHARGPPPAQLRARREGAEQWGLLPPRPSSAFRGAVCAKREAFFSFSVPHG